MDAAAIAGGNARTLFGINAASERLCKRTDRRQRIGSVRSAVRLAVFRPQREHGAGCRAGSASGHGKTRAGRERQDVAGLVREVEAHRRMCATRMASPPPVRRIIEPVDRLLVAARMKPITSALCAAAHGRRAAATMPWYRPSACGYRPARAAVLLAEQVGTASSGSYPRAPGSPACRRSASRPPARANETSATSFASRSRSTKATPWVIASTVSVLPQQIVKARVRPLRDQRQEGVVRIRGRRTTPDRVRSAPRPGPRPYATTSSIAVTRDVEATASRLII